MHDPFVQLLSQIRMCRVPVVAACEGGVWGGACDIVACCDIVIASPESTFAITPAKVGLPYHASGMTHFLSVLPLHVVKYMFLTSNPLSSEEAQRYGFVNELVSAESLAERALDLCRVVASRASLVVAVLKKQLRCLSQRASMSPELFEELHEMRKGAWESEDMQEGISSFFEKRLPKFVGR